MRDYIEAACEEIDAAMFSGDAFHDPEHRKVLKEYMGRWEREMASFQELDDEEAQQEEDKKGPKLTMTVSHIMENGRWDDYCEWSGTNVYAINEGLISSSEEVKIPLRLAREWNFA